MVVRGCVGTDLVLHAAGAATGVLTIVVTQGVSQHPGGREGRVGAQGATTVVS